ncbi:MAG: STAS domain-containing protein [Verrucomicrobiota bacterium JB022]|nr:STAS domain-containing protein [Verrucomicrobiota bacterium JB022]
MIQPDFDRVRRRLYLVFDENIISTQLEPLSKTVEEVLQAHESLGPQVIYFDLRELRMIDSMGLHWLFEVMRDQHALGRKLILQIASPAINKVVTFGGLGQLAEIKFRRRSQVR